MLKTRCGIFFILSGFFLYTASALASETEPASELEQIIISKKSAGVSGYADIKAEDIYGRQLFSNLSAGGVDPQSRNPIADIQTDFSIKGSSFQQVLLLLNGRKINDPQTGHLSCDIPITKADISDIALISSADAISAGPDAIGGSIDFRTQRPIGDKALLEAAYGSFSTKSGIFSITQKKKQLAARFSLERVESDGWQDDTDFKKLTASLFSSLDLAAADIDYSFGYQEKEYGAFDFYTPGLGYPSKEWTKTFLSTLTADIQGDSFNLKPQMLWRRHYDKFMLDKTGVRTSYLNHSRTDILSPAINLEKYLEPLGTVNLGQEYAQEKINSTYSGKHTRNRLSTSLEQKKTIGPLSLNITARFDHYDTFSEQGSGGIGLGYGLSEHDKLHFSFARNVRIPSFTELYYSDITTVSNENLSPEKAFIYELGYEHDKQNYKLDFGLFVRQEQDLIEWVKRTPSDATWQAQNIRDAQIQGASLRWRLELNRDFGAVFNYVYTDRRLKKDSYSYKYGQNYTRHLFSSSLDYSCKIGRQSLVFNYKKKPNRDGWLTVDAHLNYNIASHYRAFVNAYDIFNSAYQEIAGVPSPPRSVEFGVAIDW